LHCKHLVAQHNLSKPGALLSRYIVTNRAVGTPTAFLFSKKR
jgi:hypothetical protein